MIASLAWTFALILVVAATAGWAAARWVMKGFTSLPQFWRGFRVEVVCRLALFAAVCLLLFTPPAWLGSVLILSWAWWGAAKSLRVAGGYRRLQREQSELRALLDVNPHAWLTMRQHNLLKLAL